jgi:hypothetical protein
MPSEPVVRAPDGAHTTTPRTWNCRWIDARLRVLWDYACAAADSARAALDAALGLHGCPSRLETVTAIDCSVLHGNKPDIDI